MTQGLKQRLVELEKRAPRSTERVTVVLCGVNCGGKVVDRAIWDYKLGHFVPLTEELGIGDVQG